MSLYGADLLALLPELIVAVTACLVIALDPITPVSRRDLLAWLSVGALVLCLGITGVQINSLNERVFAFSDLVVVDAYAKFVVRHHCVSGLVQRPRAGARRGPV